MQNRGREILEPLSPSSPRHYTIGLGHASGCGLSSRHPRAILSRRPSFVSRGGLELGVFGYRPPGKGDSLVQGNPSHLSFQPRVCHCDNRGAI